MSDFHSFLRLNNISLNVYIIFCLSIHLFLGTWIVNNIAMNMGVQISLWDPAFNSLNIYPGVELLDHMVVLCLIFWGTTVLLYIAAAPFYIFINSAQRFQLLPILAKTSYFLFVFVFIVTILMSVRWHLIVILIYIFLITSGVEHLFMCWLAIVFFFGEMYIQVFCPFFNQAD